MPEGLTSIDDLKVAITADSEKLSAGLANSSELLSRFTAEGMQKLSAFDSVVGRVGNTIAALRNPVMAWIEAAKIAADAMEKLGEKAGQAAEKLGAKEEWDTFSEAMSGVRQALSDVVNGSDSTTKAASYLKREMGDLSLSFDTANLSAGELSKRGIALLTEQLERAAHEARRFTSQDTWKTHTVDAEIKRTQEYIESFKRRIESIADSGTSWFERLVGVDSSAAIAKLKTGIDQFEAELGRLGTLRTKAAWKDVTVDTDGADLIKGLEREVEALRLRAAVLGMNSAEAATFTAMEKIRQDAARTGKVIDDEATDALLRKMTAEHQKIDTFQENERRQKQVAQDAERQERGSQGILDGLDRELSGIRAKDRALTDLTGATKAQEVEERVLAMARQRNITLTDDMRLQIKDYASSIGEAEVTLRQHQLTLQNVGQVTGVVFKGVESVIGKAMDGTKFSVRDATASILNDLAKVVLQITLLKPLQTSLTAGLTGGINDGGGFLSSLLGVSGARANGGPVSGGSTYLVGENGPELFTASNSGTIIPNGQLRAGGGSPVHVTIHQNINAQGAYPESIEQIKQAMAQQNAMLPGRVLEVVGDARERGGL